jgi:hypothetical protein
MKPGSSESKQNLEVPTGNFFIINFRFMTLNRKAISPEPLTTEKLAKVHNPFIPEEMVKTKFDMDFNYNQIARANPNNIKQRYIKGHHRKLNSLQNPGLEKKQL